MKKYILISLTIIFFLSGCKERKPDYDRPKTLSAEEDMQRFNDSIMCETLKEEKYDGRYGDLLSKCQIEFENDSPHQYMQAASVGDTDNMIRWMGKEANTDEMFNHYIKLHKKWLIENHYLITKNTK